MKCTPLKRKTPLQGANARRRRARYEAAFGKRGDYIRRMPCLLWAKGPSLCEGQVQAAHVRSRGAGGTRRDLVPLCAGHHEQQHRWGIVTFQDRHRLDLFAVAAEIAADLDSRGVP